MTRRKISSPTSSLPVQIHYSDLVHSAARRSKAGGRPANHWNYLSTQPLEGTIPAPSRKVTN